MNFPNLGFRKQRMTNDFEYFSKALSTSCLFLGMKPEKKYLYIFDLDLSFSSLTCTQHRKCLLC